ncbi:versican core protein [Ceratobasidium sp. AG-Ba]|nr:versican core protein [Ceratobasidium sp. AG-Ba]
MAYDDHVRSLLNSRSARTPLGVYSPHSPDAFSIQTPRARESPSLSSWSESPSCYSQSRISVDDTASDSSATSGYYGRQIAHDSDLSMSSVLPQDDQSEMDAPYRSSYVDPLRDSSEDERTEAGGIASGSNDTLSDIGVLRPAESDTSLSSGLSVDPSPDPRLSFLGPKTRLISKAPWEEDDAIEEEAVSDTETQTDALSIFAGKLKVKGRSRSRTLTSEKASKERRFLGGGWGRSSTDTRPSTDSFKKSMESYPGAPISPRSGSFTDQLRAAGRTPSLFSTSSGASGPSGAQTPSVRPAFGAKVHNGLSINAYGIDSRAVSPAPSGSPTAASFIHPYANLDLLPPGHESESLPSRSDSNTTLTASTSASGVLTPSSSSSSAASPSQDDGFSGGKKEKRRPPQISVSPLNRAFGSIGAATKSPSALSTSFSPLSPMSTNNNDDIPPGMLGFPGSPACNLISLEQAQMKARERSMSTTSDLHHTPPLRKELTPKKSKPSLVGVGGGFSSTIGGGSPSPLWSDDGRARTVSAGSALHGRSKGYTATSNLATQSTISVNIIQGGGIENIPAASKGSVADSVASSGTGSTDVAPAKTLKPKRSGFLKFFKDRATSNSNTGNPNISAPSAPIHISHNTLDAPPPVPKVPAQFKSATLPDEAFLRDKGPPPVVVSSPARRSQSDDSHTSVGDHATRSTIRDKYVRSNTEPPKSQDNAAGAQTESFGLKLRPLSSTFNGLPEDYLTSPRVGSNARGSSETRASEDYGFEEANILSPMTPSFPQSARSTYTHTSSGSDAVSAMVDPRTPSSLGGFPPGVPRTSTDSQSSAVIIASLREQLRAVRQMSRTQINELETQIRELRLELEEARCDRCGQRPKEELEPAVEPGIVNRPRARTGGGSRTIFGANQ